MLVCLCVDSMSHYHVVCKEQAASACGTLSMCDYHCAPRAVIKGKPLWLSRRSATVGGGLKATQRSSGCLLEFCYCQLRASLLTLVDTSNAMNGAMIGNAGLWRVTCNSRSMRGRIPSSRFRSVR